MHKWLIINDSYWFNPEQGILAYFTGMPRNKRIMKREVMTARQEKKQLKWQKDNGIKIKVDGLEGT